MEVPLAGSDAVIWTQVKVPLLCHDTSEGLCPPPRDLAGTVCFGPPSFGRVIWRIHESSPSILELVEVDEKESQLSGLQLLFHEPLSPYVAIYPDQVDSNESSLCLWVITSSSIVCLSKIRRFYKYRNCLSLAKADIAQFSLASESMRLDQVTAFAAFVGSACVGGNSDTILCFTLEQLDGKVKDLCYELKESDAGFARIWGLVGRAKNAGVVRSLIIQLIEGRLMLFALHEDGTFRIWDLIDRCRLLSYNLYKPELLGYTPSLMWIQEYGLRNGPQKVAFLYAHKEGAGMDIVTIHHVLYTGTTKGVGPASISFVQKVPAIQGKVLDLKLLSEKFWRLEEVNGEYLVKSGIVSKDAPPDNFMLSEAEIESQLFQQLGDDWLDMIFFWQSTNAKAVLQFPISEVFLSRMLQPGVYQQHVLRKVLENRKRKVLESDFHALTKDGLRREILAVIEGESLNGSAMEELLEWKKFLDDYCTLWKQSTVPYGLLFDRHSECVGLIRRQSFSVIRSLTDFEKMYYEGNGQHQNKINVDTSDVFALLLRCISTVSWQLGRVSVSIFGEAVLAEKRLSAVCAAYWHLLRVGYDTSVLTNTKSHMGIDTTRRKKLDYRQRQRKFELQMILYAQQLRESAGSWDGVFNVVEKYTNHLMQDMQSIMPGQSFEDPGHVSVSKKLVVKTAAQISWTHYEAARDLLLFLGFVLGLKGQVGLTSEDVSKVRMRLIVQVQKVLLVSLVVHWLNTRFVELVPLEDFSIHLSSLHLDSTSSEVSQRKYDSYEAMTLAEMLLLPWLQDFGKGVFMKVKGLTSSEALLYNTRAFLSWIVWGENSDTQPFYASHSLGLATLLLQHGQFNALQEFLNFIWSLHSETETGRDILMSEGTLCTHLHLLGCSLLGQYRSSAKKSIKGIERAVHCFFRVASSVSQDRKELENLLHATGMQSNFPVHSSLAAWKLQYYEWVMQIFEQNSVSEAACQFAHAALQEVDEAVNGLDPEALGALPTASMIKGRLWANIFKFSLDQKLYVEAYCAIISNPERESKFICLRRFLIVLCENKATEILCGLEYPYAGLLERIEQELVLKADYSDISANPNPFKLLYSFHTLRHNYRRAALFMYLYYLRMKEIRPSKELFSMTFVLEEQLFSLAAAINCLNLSDPVYAWLDIDSEASGCLSYQASTKRLRIYPDRTDQSAARNRSAFIDLEKLRKDYTTILAELLLIEKNVKMNFHGETMPEDLLLLLVQSGLYEMAFTVLLCFWKDSPLKSELENVFRIMTEKWYMKGRDSGVKSLTREFLDDGSKMLLLTPSVIPEVAEKTSVRCMDLTLHEEAGNVGSENFLQSYLEKYSKVHSQLPVVVAESMLSIDRLIELPVWLVDMLKGGRKAGSEGMSGSSPDPASLLRIYLDYGRLSEATALLLEFMREWAVQRPGNIGKRKQMTALWFPYVLVDRLNGWLAQSRSSDHLENLESCLSNALLKHLKQIKADSQDVKSLV